MNTSNTAEETTRLLAADLHSIGSISYQPRLGGYALLEDGVMFGFVAADGVPYLRATAATAGRFHDLGATKHADMPYWTIPAAIAADRAVLCELAYEAADLAHMAFLFGIDDEPAVVRATRPMPSALSLALLAA